MRCMRLAAGAHVLPERVQAQAAPLASLELHSRRRRRSMQPTTCSAGQPAQELECSRQGWCRPLSGCAAPAPSTDISNSSGGSHAATAEQLPPIVALGKFDALHRGHRALAAAAAQLGGAPWLVSFSGMAEVLGWPARLPLVAPCDRQRVLQTWARHCEGRAPRECSIPFAEVRSMSPEAFVELLATELQVAGVVVGSNYRFGYRAAGTAELLQQLGPQHGLRIGVLDLVGSQQQQQQQQAAAPQAAVAAGQAAAAAAEVGAAGDQQALQQHQQQAPADGGQRHAASGAAEAAAAARRQQAALDREEAHQAVSSSRVRHGLAAGDMADVQECLGRPYRLVASLAEGASSALPDGPALRLPSSALLNQPPAPGRYQVQAAVVGSSTLEQLLPPWQAELRVDAMGITLHGAGQLAAVGGLPQGAQHLTLDFLA